MYLRFDHGSFRTRINQEEALKLFQEKFLQDSIETVFGIVKVDIRLVKHDTLSLNLQEIHTLKVYLPEFSIDKIVSGYEWFCLLKMSFGELEYKFEIDRFKSEQRSKYETNRHHKN